MATKVPERLKAHCPKCGPQRWANVKAHFQVHEDHDKYVVWSMTYYFILQCPACEEVYFMKDGIFSEDYDYDYNHNTGEEEMTMNHSIEQWPSPSKREIPAWTSHLFGVDDKLHSILLDTYKALDNDLRVFAAIGIRTAFDSVSEFLKIDPAMGFGEKLDEFVKLGKIGLDERGMLDALTDAGSAAAHRGWKPTPEQLDIMMASIEGFIYRTYILGAEAEKLKAAVPSKLRRTKKPLASSDG